MGKDQAGRVDSERELATRSRGFSLGKGEAKARSQAAIEGDGRVDLFEKRRIGARLAKVWVERGQAVVARQPEGGGVSGIRAGQLERGLRGRFEEGGVDEAGQGHEGRGAVDSDLGRGPLMRAEVEANAAGHGVGRA